MATSTITFTTFTDVSCTTTSGNPLTIGFISGKLSHDFDKLYDAELPIPPPPPSEYGSPLTTSYINQLYLNTSDDAVQNIPAYAYYLPATTDTLKTLSLAARNNNASSVFFKYSTAGLNTIFKTLEITDGSWTLKLLDGSVAGSDAPSVSIAGDDVIVTLPTLGENLFYSMKVEKYVPVIMTETITIINKGWNMISVPASAKISNPDNGIASSIYYFNGSLYETSQVKDDSLEPYKGYWIKTNANGLEVTITYNSPYLSTDIKQYKTSFEVANRGWNMISVPASAKISNPDNGIASSIYYFNGSLYETSQVKDDSLEPYKGYWIKTNANGLKVTITYSD
jgi:hypothetical protein